MFRRAARHSRAVAAFRSLFFSSSSCFFFWFTHTHTPISFFFLHLSLVMDTYIDVHIYIVYMYVKRDREAEERGNTLFTTRKKLLLFWRASLLHSLCTWIHMYWCVLSFYLSLVHSFHTHETHDPISLASLTPYHHTLGYCMYMYCIVTTVNTFDCTRPVGDHFHRPNPSLSCCPMS